MVHPETIWNVMSYYGVTKYLTNSLVDFILPRFCCSCSTKLSLGQDTMCNDCISKIQKSTAERLQREFDRKFEGKNIISDFYSPFVFEKDKELQQAIHSLKYQKKYRVGIFLGQLLGSEIKISKPDIKIDLVIPVPLHQLKKAERGYNQAFYIAKGVSKVLNVNASDRIVKRIKYTESQTKMNLTEREINISDAFKVRKKQAVAGKNILLLDDVITTGATISECGKILLESGAKKIYAASVAIAD
jgi:ComF family protein